jgi:hypothetical protein
MAQHGIILRMLVSHSNAFIFVKTKKTAGSTVESIIVDNFFDSKQDVCTGSKIDDTPRIGIGEKRPNEPDGHKPWNMIKSFVGKNVWNSYHKFTVERNPWEKVVSEFYWKTEREPDFKGVPFDSFVDNVLGSWYACPQDWALYADDSGLQVDQVIQYSELADSLVSLFNDKFGLPLTKEMVTGTRKKSGFRKKHYTELYTDQRLIDKVSAMYKKEIEFFNYKFGE